VKGVGGRDWNGREPGGSVHQKNRRNKGCQGREGNGGKETRAGRSGGRRERAQREDPVMGMGLITAHNWGGKENQMGDGNLFINKIGATLNRDVVLPLLHAPGLLGLRVATKCKPLWPATGFFT